METHVFQQVIRAWQESPLPQRPVAIGTEAGGRVTQELTAVLVDQRFDVFIHRKRKMQCIGDAFQIPLIERGEILRGQAEALGYRFGERDRKPGIRLPSWGQVIRSFKAASALGLCPGNH